MSYLSIVVLTFLLSILGCGVIGFVLWYCFPARSTYPNTIHGRISMAINSLL